MFDIQERGLPSGTPAHRTRQQNHATLLVSWWCTGFALVIILLRVAGRFVRTERLFKEDKIMFWSIVPLLIRMGFCHVVMLYGTNNSATAGLSAIELYHRSIGSRMVLASRIFYAAFIWTAKWTVSEFLKRLAVAIWNPTYERVLKGIRIFLIVTFIGVVISTLAECQPFDHYWQVVPDPGPTCRDGYAQLLTMGISDSLTDVMLIVFPIPIILKSQMPYPRKISLILLFMLSVILIAITVIRVENIIELYGRQQRRTLWASIEILAAAAVSNALILGSFVRDRGVKKQKYRGSGMERMESNNPSINRKMTLQHWGSDEDVDLFRTLGCRLNSVTTFQEEEENLDNPPLKMTDMTHLNPNGDPDAISGSWNQTRTFQSLSDFLIADEVAHTLASKQKPKHRVLLARYGGNGDDVDEDFSPTDPRPATDGTSTLTPSDEPSILRHDFALADGRGRRHSDMSLADPGGLLSPLPPRTAPNGPIARSRSPESDMSLADPGGLLSPLPSRTAPSGSFARSRSPESEMSLADPGGLLSPLPLRPPQDGPGSRARSPNVLADLRSRSRGSRSRSRGFRDVASRSRSRSTGPPARLVGNCGSGAAQGPDDMQLSDAGGLLG